MTATGTLPSAPYAASPDTRRVRAATSAAHLKEAFGGVPSLPAPGGPPGSYPSFPLHAQTSAKAETQTSSQRTCSTVGAPPPPHWVVRSSKCNPRTVSHEPAERPSRDPHDPRADNCRPRVLALNAAGSRLQLRPRGDRAGCGVGWGGRSPGARRVPHASHPAPWGSRAAARVFFSAREGSPGSSRRRPPPLP